MLSALFQRKRNGLSNKDDLYKKYKLLGIVLPNDLDLYLHMNNSRYTRECDFGRMHVWFNSGMCGAVMKLKAKVVVSAISVRYRRPLALLQLYHVTTQLLCWDHDAMYFEQGLVTRDGFIAAIVLVKMAVRGSTPTDLVATMFNGVKQESRQPSPELVAWKESITLSSKRLRPTR